MRPEIDTLRVLVGWDCNLDCDYCCNKQERLRSQFRPVALDDIDFAPYETICISGGEPLLAMDRVGQILARTKDTQTVVLSTNGLLLTPLIAHQLRCGFVDAVNVGLHIPRLFGVLINRISAYDWGDVKVRFNVEDTYDWLPMMYPKANLHFWRRDDCDRPNEDRVLLA